MNIDRYLYEAYNNENYRYGCEDYREDREWRDCRENRQWRCCREDREPRECRRHNNRQRSSASIIPFASGGPITLATFAPNSQQLSAAIAFGNNAAVIISPTTGDITLTPTNFNMAFSMPRFGVIRSIAAYFSINSGVTIPTGTTVTVRAQLYQSTGPNDTFTPIPGALVNLAPSFNGTLAPGNRVHAILRNLNIPVRPETRLLLVFSAVASPNTAQVVITGQASAGISIR